MDRISMQWRSLSVRNISADAFCINGDCVVYDLLFRERIAQENVLYSFPIASLAAPRASYSFGSIMCLFHSFFDALHFATHEFTLSDSAVFRSRHARSNCNPLVMSLIYGTGYQYLSVLEAQHQNSRITTVSNVA